MKIRLAAIFLVCLAAAYSAEAAITRPRSPGTLRFVNLVPAFDRMATAAAALPDDKAKVALFEQQMGPLAQGFYARARKPDDYDRRVLAFLKVYPERRAKILAMSREFERLFWSARSSFTKTFGRVSSKQPVYLLHSLGETDGGTRILDGKATLVFGADVTARIHDHDMAPFLHHELFHLFHAERVMKDCDLVWCSMWEEGLATYVAARLNPQAGDAALMLDTPAPVRPAVDADLAGAARAVAPMLNSGKHEDYAKLFFGDAHVEGFPARMGYYLGYLVAADLGRSRSLGELAAIRPAELKPLFMRSFAKMGECAALQRDGGRRTAKAAAPVAVPPAVAHPSTTV